MNSLIIFTRSEREATEAFAKACHMKVLEPMNVNVKNRSIVSKGRVLKFRPIAYMNSADYLKDLTKLSMNVNDFFNKYGGGVYGY